MADDWLWPRLLQAGPLGSL
jgi:hypothetical protein